jgi:hypothetical protein
MRPDKKNPISFLIFNRNTYLVISGLIVSMFALGQESFTTERMIECEQGTLKGSMQKYTGGDASGGIYVMNHYTVTKRLDDPDLQALPDVSYSIDIPSAGDYFLWLRVRVPVSGNKVFGKYLSIYIGTDNSNYNSCIVTVNKSWEWQRVTNLRLKPGKHTLDFKHKDFGFGIDELFLTATGSDLSGLGMNPGREEILKVNRNIMTPITYPPLTEKDGLGLNFPKPPAEHPRLFLRARDIQGLKEKAMNPLMKMAWDKIVAASKEQTDGMLDAPADGLANFTMKTINAIEAKALMYVLYKDKTSGRNAVEAMINFFNTVKFNPSTSDIYRLYGRFMLSGAMVYDWCYDLLTNEEKSVLIGWMETMAAGMEIGGPAIKQGSVTGHASEFQLMRDIMAVAISTYDEKKDMYMLAAGRFFKYWVPVRAFFYPAAYHHQGVAYGGYRFMCELYATALFDRMGFPEIFGKEQKNVPYFALYNRRPDGQIMRDGDDYVSKTTESYWSRNGASDVICASIFKDPVIMGEAMREIKEFGSSGDYLFDFLLADPSLKPLPVDKLPLSRYFPGPLGAMVARTSWESGKKSSTAVVVMKLGEYQFSNHQHLDCGNFQFYYKGALVSEGGYYDAYGSDHDYSYNKRTIAHNSILVNDPDEHFSRLDVNDGGQRFPNGGNEPADLEVLISKGYKVGDLMAHQVGPDHVKPEFTYLKGDLTNAYTTKVQQFQRSFVFLNLNSKEHPAVLVVFDRVTSSNKSFKKTWLLHCIEEPVIKGTNTTIARTQKDYSGKLINTTLLPESENMVISKVGGPGHESEVMGINHPARSLPDPLTTSDESGSWRIEVSPKDASVNDLFLNVMQVMDNSTNILPLTTNKIISDKMVGTEIADRVVLFSKTGDKLGENIDFTLSGSGKLKVLITDLKDGFWKLEKPGENAKEEYQVTKDGSTLYFSGKAGKYKLTRSDK